MTRAVDCVIFDLDGTLIDSARGVERSLARAIEAVAPGRPLHSGSSMTGVPLHELIVSALETEDGPLVQAAEAAFRQVYDSEGWRDFALYEGVAQLLSILADRGLRVHLLTNKRSVPTRMILDELGWTPYFDRVVCLDSRTPPFQDKVEALQDLITATAVPVERALLVGDGADDERAAKECQIQFIPAAYGYGSAAQRANASREVPRLDRPADLLTLLEDIPSLLVRGR